MKSFIDQAELDIESAKHNLKNRMPFVASFFCRDAATNALMELYIYEKKKSVPKNMTLLDLSEKVSIPKGFKRLLNELSVVTRKSSDKKYSDGKLTRERIKNTQKFVLAVKKIMFN